MKALSIRQPWAWLIIHGGKDIENREWTTGVRGNILVHASKGMTQQEYEDAADFATECGFTKSLPAFEELKRGGIIGIVEIVDCVTQSKSPWFVGRYGFVLKRPYPLPFKEMKGQLGFFEATPTTPP